MNAFSLDLRHALRALHKNVGYTLVAVLTLTLAIAATTTVFAVVDATIIRPLPFAEPDRLVQVWERTPEGNLFSASEPDYLDFARETRTLSGLAAFKPADLILTGAGEPRRVRGVAATQTLFQLLGVRPAFGRTFASDEDLASSNANVAVLSHAFWQSRFGGDSSIVGRTITLSGQLYSVIGVMPASIRFPDAEAYIPLRADANSRRGDHWLQLVGRLRPGATIDDASRDFERIALGLGATYPGNKGWSTRVESLYRELVDDTYRRAGWVLLGATGLLLLLACANVANLMLARATTRMTELGVRAAIGASTGRLVRLWLTESAVLVAVASALGITAAVWAHTAIRALGAGHIPRLEETAIDGRVLAVAVALSALTTIICALVPALRMARIDPAAVLGENTRAGASKRHRRVRDALVVLQIALSVLLSIGAGLLLRSFSQLSTVDAGFDAQHVVAVKLSLPDRQYDEAARSIFYTRLSARLGALPGVRAVGATAVDPFSGWNFMNDVTPADRAATSPASGFTNAAWRSVTPDFFSAMGITTLRGRVFSKDDAWDGPRIVVISRSLASKLWPGADAIGKALYWGGTSGKPRIVVGVVNDIRDVAPQSEPLPTLFLPSNQVPMPGMTVVVRTAGDPTSMTEQLRNTIHALDAAIPVEDIHPLARNRLDAMASPRFTLWLLAAFATIALVLAASGVYAVVGFNVAQRRREIGLRLALGAAPEGVVGFFCEAALRWSRSASRPDWPRHG